MIEERVNIKGIVGIDTIKIYPVNQSKEVIPRKEEQIIKADEGYDGLSSVSVKPIPDEYIIPTGTIDIVENGLHNVKDKEFANVNVPEKQLGTKTITENGTYKASDDNLDGYSEVEVSTSGVDINEYYDLTKRTSGKFSTYIKQIPMIDTSDYTLMNYMFSGYNNLTTIPQLDTNKVVNMDSLFSDCSSLTSIPQLDTSNVKNMNSTFNHCSSLTSIPQLDTSSVINMEYTFYYCSSLTTIPQLDTSNVSSMTYMIAGCSSLTTIPQLDTSNVKNMNNMFYGCSKLTTIGGFKDLGKAYSTTQSANYNYYKLDLSKSTLLTHDSLMNVINNLYDIASIGVQSQQLALGSTNLAKLTEEEIAIATNKGWSVS